MHKILVHLFFLQEQNVLLGTLLVKDFIQLSLMILTNSFSKKSQSVFS